MGRYKKYKKLAALIGAKVEPKKAFMKAWEKQKDKGLKEYGHSLKDSGLSIDEVRAHQLEEFVDIIAYQEEIDRLTELKTVENRRKKIRFYKAVVASNSALILIKAIGKAKCSDNQVAMREVVNVLHKETQKPESEVDLKKCEDLFQSLLVLNSESIKIKPKFDTGRIVYEKE